MTESEIIIIFTRYPEPGTTKTRMIPLLGDVGAAELARQMTEHTVKVARSYISDAPGMRNIEIQYTGGNFGGMQAWLGKDLCYVSQVNGNLGDRMSHAVGKAFENGATYVTVIGTDCPGLTERHLRETFESLRQNDSVIGPAGDGGYYLFGIRLHAGIDVIPSIYPDIEWGSKHVLFQTVTHLRDIGLSFCFIERLDDVDRPEDLPVWNRIKRINSTGKYEPVISVIIPVLNEANAIERTIECLDGAHNLEIIVVDGGSTDDTVSQVINRGINLITSERGRANQMNAGVEAVSGDYLLFLHADTVLELGFDHEIRRILADPSVACGAFTLKIDSPHKFFRFIEFTTHFRTICMKMPYGDQGLFLRADMLARVNGIPQQPIMEDFELLRRIRRYGKIVVSNLSALTSARRWHMRGFIRYTLLNQLIILAYLMGISPNTLHRWYYDNEINRADN